jgi:hypothetical protein
MENQIKINGQEASGEPLHWLYNQNISFLHHFIATQVLSAIIAEGKSNTTVPTAPEAQAIFVLLDFLDQIREIKEGRA